MMEEKNENKYIWYACYGSNLYRERFLWYIQGGGLKGNPGCKDRSLPVADCPYLIRHALYFAGESRTWGHGGVAFISKEHDPGAVTLSRAYLVTEEQFKDIQGQEGRWYGCTLELGMLEGFPVRTFTRDPLEFRDMETNNPSDAYLEVIRKGLRETYPGMTEEQITGYLDKAAAGRG
ncbi:MAG: hypothetical protein R6W96_05235 [Clostridia bacterium]